MSALPPKADINAHRLGCLLSAKADIGGWFGSDLMQQEQLAAPQAIAKHSESDDNLDSPLDGPRILKNLVIIKEQPHCSAGRLSFGRFNNANRDPIVCQHGRRWFLSLHFLFKDMTQHQERYWPNSDPKPQPLCVSFF
jgi:hypothetical protein